MITGHRRENHGQGLENICTAIAELARNFSDVQFIYTVHPNPKVQEPVNRILGSNVVQDEYLDSCDITQFKSKNLKPKTNNSNIHLIKPLDYPSFIWLMDKAKLIITDSGGVQEEAPSLGKPVLVTRNTTERPEAVEAGNVILVGTDTDKIVAEVSSLLLDEPRYQSMSCLQNTYGDGRACSRIVDFIVEL